jgi:2-oxoisovalerate dehydrogenase E1 component beta subunit
MSLSATKPAEFSAAAWVGVIAAIFEIGAGIFLVFVVRGITGRQEDKFRRYRSGGEFWAPITVRAPCGGGIFGGQTHSQSVEAIFTHVCGLKTVIPCNPYDAKGLLISAVEDDDPVVFFEPKRLYNGPFDGHPDRPSVPWTQHPQSEVPEGYYSVPLGKAAIVRPGDAVTVLAYGTMVHVALAAAEEAGIDAEVIDLRTLLPLDTTRWSIRLEEDRRCVIAHGRPAPAVTAPMAALCRSNASIT